MRWTFLAFAVLATLLAVVSFVGFGQDQSGDVVNCLGSTSVQPFAELLAEEYDRLHPDARVDVQGGGSTAGLQAVANGIVQIGMCSRSLKSDEMKQFRGIPIALDGLAVVVHSDNPITDLSLAQIRAIFHGDITNWKDVGGVDGPIRLITREEGSGTREAFQKLVMDAAGAEPGNHTANRISRKAMTQESNGAVKELIVNDRFAVGYMSLGLVQGQLRMVSVNGVVPSRETVVLKTYPLVRPFLFVVTGEPSPPTAAFIEFVLSSQGQAMLEKEGLVSVR